MKHQINILLCEDESIVALDLERQLQRCGYNVTGVVAQGEDAIDLASRVRPDLALMDIRLAGKMNGIETARVLRDQFDVPSVFVSAFSDSNTLESAKDIEPLGFLVKPIGEANLRSTIEIGISVHRRQKTFLKYLQNVLKFLSGRTGPNERIDRYISDFLRLNRLQGLGELCANISTWFGEQLAEVGMRIKRVESANQQSDLSKDLERASAAHSWLDQLVRRLKIIGQQVPFTSSCCSIQELVEGSVSALRAVLPPDIEVITNFPGEKLHVSVSEELVNATLLSLIKNAADAMPNGGVVTVDCRLVFEELPERFNPDAAVGWYVVVRVGDTGRGLTQDQVAHLFEPFSANNPRKGGPGLDLAMVHSVMQMHRGWAGVESEVGTGTTTFLCLPQFAPKTINSPETNAVQFHDNRGIILLIDDEGSLLEVLQKLLGLEGFRVYGFTSGTDALAWYENHSSEVDLVLTDLRMPEIDGREVFYRVRAVNPQQQVALMSGFADENVIKELLNKGASRLFEKPFDINVMTAWINSTIRAKSKRAQ